MKTILLLGATGQVGWELARTLLPLGTPIAPGRDRCDLGRPASVAAIVDEVRPAVIVNAAAYTAVDRAEEEETLARTVNSDSPAELAKAARRNGALLVHYSTDYVFDGRKADPYTEADFPNPLNVYGRTKLEGEKAIQSAGADHLILRTSWVYGARGSNFLRTILRLACEREELRIVDDQFGAPTWSRAIATATALAIQQDLERRRQGTFCGGIVNLTAAGFTTWYGFARAIVDSARKRGFELKCRKILPIAAAQYPLPARRPANSRLICSALSERYGLRMPSWDRSLELCLDELSGAARTENP